PDEPNALQNLLMLHGNDDNIMEQLQQCIAHDPSLVTTQNKAWPLYLAAVHSPLEKTVAICTLLLENNADVNAFIGGWTALHVAVEREDIPLIQWLLSRGARATYREEDSGLDPFYYAAKK